MNGELAEDVLYDVYVDATWEEGGFYSVGVGGESRLQHRLMFTDEAGAVRCTYVSDDIIDIPDMLHVRCQKSGFTLRPFYRRRVALKVPDRTRLKALEAMKNAREAFK